jgi:hypothetical protein
VRHAQRPAGRPHSASAAVADAMVLRWMRRRQAASWQRCALAPGEGTISGLGSQSLVSDAERRERNIMMYGNIAYRSAAHSAYPPHAKQHLGGKERGNRRRADQQLLAGNATAI